MVDPNHTSESNAQMECSICKHHHDSEDFEDCPLAKKLQPDQVVAQQPEQNPFAMGNMDNLPPGLGNTPPQAPPSGQVFVPPFIQNGACPHCILYPMPPQILAKLHLGQNGFPPIGNSQKTGKNYAPPPPELQQRFLAPPFQQFCPPSPTPQLDQVHAQNVEKIQVLQADQISAPSSSTSSLQNTDKHEKLAKKCLELLLQLPMAPNRLADLENWRDRYQKLNDTANCANSGPSLSESASEIHHFVSLLTRIQSEFFEYFKMVEGLLKTPEFVELEKLRGERLESDGFDAKVLRHIRRPGKHIESSNL